MTISRKKILVFLLLTFSFSAVFYYLILTSNSMQSYVAGLMWCPGIAAMLTQVAFHRSLRGLGWKAGRAGYLFLGYGLPIIYCLVLYGIVWLVGLGRLVPERLVEFVAMQSDINGMSMVQVVSLLVTLGFLSSCITAAGEEIGWRGLLVPELVRETSYTNTALISGGIWALWHYPGILFSDYGNLATPLWFRLVSFSLSVIGISFVLAWLRLKSDSLWPAVVLHASHNLFIQGVFTPLTADTGLTDWVIDEFGIGLALLALLMAWWLWRKRGELADGGAS